MNQTLKTSHSIAILAILLIVSIIYIVKTGSQTDGIAKFIQPQSQLAQVTSATTLSLTTASPTTVGSTFTVNITLNTGGRAVYGVDINRLRFNPAMLQVVDANTGTAGVQVAPGSLMAISIINTVDNSAGTVQFSQVANPGSTFTGIGTVASVTFRVLAVGTSNVTIDFSQGSGTDSNVAGLGGDILTSVTGGSYTGTAVVVVPPTPPADTTAPTISNVTFSGLSTTGITIAWTTANENSNTQVEYGLTSSYGSQTALNASLTSAHTATLSGLSPGTAHHYRVRSRDAAGNLAVSTDNIFTTLAAADSTAPTVPSGVTATATGETQIQLSWTASTDPAGTGQNVSGIARYQVFRGGTLLGTAPSTAYLDTGLTVATAYSYRISAVDTAGNISGQSTAVSATTRSASVVDIPLQRKIILSLEGATNTGKAVSGVIEFLDPVTRAKIYQANIVTDASGQYVMNIPAGLVATVVLRPKIPGYISKLIMDVDLRNASVLEVNSPVLRAGDFNGDQIVNSLDFSYMNSKWGAVADALADINRDGGVNSIDFSYLSSNWLATGE